MVPAGTQIGTFGSYQIWFAQMDWQYICYFQTDQNSVNINLRDFIQDTLSRGYLNSSWYLHDIEAGFEICSGGEGLMVESFSAEVEEITPSSIPLTSQSESTTSIKLTISVTGSYHSSLSFLVIFLGLVGGIPIYSQQRKQKKRNDNSD